MLTKREVLLGKIESTYNTDSLPTAASNAILVENPQLKPSKVRMAERMGVRSSLAALKPVYGGSLSDLTFDVELKGSGTAGTAPELGVLLRACGCSETLVASTSVTYRPVSEDHESMTFYYYQDGIQKILSGAVGTASWAIKAGDIIKFSFTFTGHVNPATDIPMPAPSYDAIVPAPAVNFNFTVGGTSFQIETLNIDLGNEIATPASVSSIDGYGKVRITARKVTGSIDPEKTLVATKDFEADWKAGVTAALTTNTIGSTAGNIVTIAAPSIHYLEVTDAEREGIRTQELNFGAAEVSGDDEISIVFT